MVYWIRIKKVSSSITQDLLFGFYMGMIPFFDLFNKLFKSLTGDDPVELYSPQDLLEIKVRKA